MVAAVASAPTAADRAVEEPASSGPGAPPLGPASRLAFRSLSIVPDGDAFLVGSAEAGVFLAVPEAGAVSAQSLADGRTVAEAAADVLARTGVEVDVLDFAGVLLEAGLVGAVDGVSLSAEEAIAPAAGRAWLTGVRPELVRPAFGVVAWHVYGMLALLGAAMFVARPRFWPSFEDAFFYPNPAVCVVTLVLLNVALTASHEVAHWLAARAVGVGVRFSVGQRAFFPVFETDLSQLWSIPRRQRWSPFLAGMAHDVVILFTTLSLRVAWGEGWIDLPPTLVRFLGALVLLQVVGLGWQTLVFLRTDLYAVLVVALGCYNLQRVTHLTVRRWTRRLRSAEAVELAAAHPRDLRVARWFAPLSLVGFGWVALVFVSFFVPSTVLMAGWLFVSLPNAPLGSADFWQALVIALLAAYQALLPLGIFLWHRLGRRARRARLEVRTA